MRSTNRHSFCLDRPGARRGYRVKPRLRIVDTVTIAVQIASVFGSIAIWVWLLRWLNHVVLLNQPVVIVAVMFAILWIVLYIVPTALVWCMRVLFLVSGLLSKEEARSYPLNWGKHAVDAWPEAWQEPEGWQEGSEPQAITSRKVDEGGQSKSRRTSEGTERPT